MKKIVIDPSIKITYSSFYIKGLEDVFGKKNISFSAKYFKNLKRKSVSNSYDHYMSFVLVDGFKIIKVIVDFRDKVSVKESAYEWCDIYAKINYNRKLTESRFQKKIVSITPSFGIKIWGFWETVFFCISNLLKCNTSLLVPIKSHLRDYLIPYYKYPSIGAYYEKNQDCKNVSEPEQYIFCISTLWPHENCIEGTNFFRKKFIEFCKLNEQIKFEGGFHTIFSHPQYAEYKDHLFLKYYSKDSYIKKTISSLFVFNTPAVHNCHGWKLGEYLAMSKAIISTPLSNELPEELIHGVNIHIVADVSEIEKSIGLLLINDDYRRKLEDGAKIYYSKHGNPKSVIENILKIHLKHQ